MSPLTDSFDGRGELVQPCAGCGIALPPVSGEGHPYMEGSAACWHGYGLLLAAQYADPARMAFNQLIVDAYAVQHPGAELPQQVQSVAIHLMTLALILEDRCDPRLGPALHRRMIARPTFHYLPRPTSSGTVTFDHVPLQGPGQRARAAAEEWARSAWHAWQPHHQIVDEWLRTAGMR